MNKNIIADSHCHLHYYEESQLCKILAEAKAAGVGFMQTVATKLDEIPAILRLVESNHAIFGSVGIHPLNVGSEVVQAERIIELCKNHKKIIGIGETGLDLYRANNLELQQLSFIEHIKAAQETTLPLIVHTRSADKETLKVLRSEQSQKPYKAVIHCFSSDLAFALECIEMGLYISASGIITFKTAQDLRDTFRIVPLDRILIETDSPYLAPVPHRGKQNKPAYIVEVAKALADIKNISYDEIVKATTHNFITLFNMDVPTA